MRQYEMIKLGTCSIPAILFASTREIISALILELLYYRASLEQCFGAAYKYSPVNFSVDGNVNT